MEAKYFVCKDCDFNHFIDTGHTNYTRIDEEDIPKGKGFLL